MLLLNKLALIIDTSQSLKIKGVLSSKITFFLTSINSSSYQKKFDLELEITITLKFVKLSGRVKLTFAFQFSSVITLGLKYAVFLKIFLVLTALSHHLKSPYQLQPTIHNLEK